MPHGDIGFDIDQHHIFAVLDAGIGGLGADGRRPGHIGDDVDRVELRRQGIRSRDHALPCGQGIHRRADGAGFDDSSRRDPCRCKGSAGGAEIGVGQHVHHHAGHLRHRCHKAAAHPAGAADADAYGAVLLLSLL